MTTYDRHAAINWRKHRNRQSISVTDFYWGVGARTTPGDSHTKEPGTTDPSIFTNRNLQWNMNRQDYTNGRRAVVKTLELRRFRLDLIFYYKVLNFLNSANPKSVLTVNSSQCLCTNLPVIHRPVNASTKILSTTCNKTPSARNSLLMKVKLSAYLSYLSTV